MASSTSASLRCTETPEEGRFGASAWTLGRVSLVGDGWEVTFLALAEIDEAGRIIQIDNFDEDQLDVALDVLDERWIAGEGAEDEYVIRRMGDFRAAYADRDWPAIEALVADDFTFVDHRPIGLPQNDRAGYLQVMRESVDQTPDMRLLSRAMEIRGDVVLLRTQRVGSTSEGFAYDWEQFAVNHFAGGLLRRVELFPLESEAEARARFEELAREPRTPFIDNRLVRVMTRIGWLSMRAEVDPADLYATDCVLVDHRPGVNAGSVAGRTGVSDSIRSGIEVFGELRVEPLAVRGDRLALYRWAFVADGGFEAPGITVMEMDDDDRICRITSFDESDIAKATEVLEDRHRELTAGGTVVDRVRADQLAAFNRHDVDAMAAGWRADLRLVDRQPLGFGEQDVALAAAEYEVLFEQLPDVAGWVVKAYSRGPVELRRLRAVGHTADGSDAEYELLAVVLLDDGGLVAENAYYSLTQWDEALAHFDGWSRFSGCASRAAHSKSGQRRSASAP